MKRRIATLVLLVVVLLAAFAGPAAGQDSPPPSVAPSTTVQVKGAALSRTGSDIWPTVIVSLALTGAGTVLVLAARRRRHSLAA